MHVSTPYARPCHVLRSLFTPWAADLGDSACMSFLNSTGQWSRKAPCDSAAEANLAFVCELDKLAKGGAR